MNVMSYALSKHLKSHMNPDAERILLAWLAEHGPEEWHAVADGWNWDAGEKILGWILEQERCDLATARLIFARADPLACVFDDSGAFRSTVVEGDLFFSAIAMTRFIFARFREGTFLEHKIKLSIQAESDFEFFVHEYPKSSKKCQNLPNDLLWPDGFEKTSGSILVEKFDEGTPIELSEIFHKISLHHIRRSQLEMSKSELSRILSERNVWPPKELADALRSRINRCEEYFQFVPKGINEIEISDIDLKMTCKIYYDDAHVIADTQTIIEFLARIVVKLDEVVWAR
jgi:Domain of unknown function (DUF4274)